MCGFPSSSFLLVCLWLCIPCRPSFYPASLRLFLNVYLFVSPILWGRCCEDRGVLPLPSGDSRDTTPSVFSLTGEGIRIPNPGSCARVTVQLRAFVVRCQVPYSVWVCICAWIKRHRAFSGPNSQLCLAYGNHGIRATVKAIYATSYLLTSQTLSPLFSSPQVLLELTWKQMAEESLLSFFTLTYCVPCSAQVYTVITLKTVKT